jgi:hypothetical protein
VLSPDEELIWQALVEQLRGADASTGARAETCWKRVAWAFVEAMAHVSYRPAFLTHLEAD